MEQQNYYNEIINYLMNGTVGPGRTDQEKAVIVKRSSKYKVVGGVLYHKGKGRGIDDLRLVLTDPVDQENAIRTCHVNENTGRHFGRNKTASLLASKYYWRMMYTDVMHQVAECTNCCLNRELLERKSMQDRTKVWKLVEVEFLENFHTTRHYTFHLLKVVDVFSKWTRCVAVHNNSERNIVGTLLEQFASFGFPTAVRFVNCKAMTATLSALQKELELFIKRAGDVLPILDEAGVNVDGINTCFKDLTVHVAVEEGENVLCDFESFEDYLRAFQFSRGQEEASSPVFHVLFGQQSVVEEPIRDWLMDKICHLQKQNAYNWASQMPFYMFCLQNCVPPTMTQSPFSIMFNRCAREEPLWCWYDKTQLVRVHDDSPLDCKEKKFNKHKVPQKVEMQSILKKKEPQKRHQSNEPDCKPEKKVRLDVVEKKSGLDRSALLRRSAVMNSLIKPTLLHKTIKDSPLFADKLKEGDVYSHTPVRQKPGHRSYLYMNKDGSLMEKPIDGGTPLNKAKNCTATSLSKPNRERKPSGQYAKNKSTANGTPSSKSAKENLSSNKLVKDNLPLNKSPNDSVPTSKSSMDKKSSSKSDKDNQQSTKDNSSRTPATGKDIGVLVANDNHLSLVKPSIDITPSKDLTNNSQPGLLPNVSLVEDEQQILRSLCMEQSLSTLKKRFPGRPYKKKTRKYVDMSTEVPVHRPHEVPPTQASVNKVPTKNILEQSSPPIPKSTSKPRVNGEETASNPTRYSFRQNLKPKGPSSYVQRFIAISSSKRTTTNESDLELSAPNSSLDNGSMVGKFLPISMPIKDSSIDGGLVEDPKFPPVAEEVELVTCNLIQEILDSPNEIVIPPLTNGDCEEDTMPYESELCIDSSSVATRDLPVDLDISQQNNAIPFSEESISNKDVPADELVFKPTDIIVKSAPEKAKINSLTMPKQVMNTITRTLSKKTKEIVKAPLRMPEELLKTISITLPKKPQEIEKAPEAEVLNLVPPTKGGSTSGSSIDGNSLDLPCSDEDSFSADKYDVKPCRVALSRLSGFVNQRALEGTIQLRRVNVADRCSIFMGDLKIAEYSTEILVQKKKVVVPPLSMCKLRVIQKRKYAKERPFKCSVCPRTFLESEEEVTLHMRFHDEGVEGNGLFCPVCKRSGPSWRLIFKHYFSHKEAMGDAANITSLKYRKVCTTCRKVFATEERYQKHVRTTHPGKEDPEFKFKCNDCGLTFKEPKGLAQHQHVHNDTSYTCSECGYSTKTHYNYILHTKFHESQRLDVAAKEGNSAKLTDVTSLDENGMFSCRVCNYKTLTDVDLISHIHQRHGTKRATHLCDQCGKKFRSQVQLCNHVLTHKPSMNFFVCKLCPYKAKYKSVIHKHAKKQHPNFALKDVVQRPKIILKPGRPCKAVTQKVEIEEEVHNPEDDIPEATIVVRTDENGELMVCEEDEAVEPPQIICVDAEGNFVLEESGQTLQIVGGEDQVLYGGEDQVLLVSMEPGNS